MLQRNCFEMSPARRSYEKKEKTKKQYSRKKTKGEVIIAVLNRFVSPSVGLSSAPKSTENGGGTGLGSFFSSLFIVSNL